jgi:hypothetical protein
MNFPYVNADDVGREKPARVVLQKRSGADDPMSFPCAGQWMGRSVLRQTGAPGGSPAIPPMSMQF